LSATAILPGIGEELFFRGFVVAHGLRLADRSLILAMSAFLFGFVHFDPVQSPLAAAMGLFLVFAVLTTESLIPVIVAHVLNNTLATMAPDFGEDPGTSAWIYFVIGAVLSVLAVLFLLRRHVLWRRSP
jgi:uncharacterized protein